MADNYTPTTEQVRTAATEQFGRMRTPAEFDRWLAADRAKVAAQARADERERIAAAIEAESAYRNGRDRAQWGDLERIVDITFATAARIARTPDPNGDNT